MLVSWSWLKDYVSLPATPQEFAERLMMAGLNHESTNRYGSDFVIDLEVTSNRTDCLGHIGIARETALLFQNELKVPDAKPIEGNVRAEQSVQVAIECPQHCRQYSARVLKGVKVGASPAWLVARLESLGITSVNNVVDATNYVLMESGQPLHAFDLRQLRGNRVVVRTARTGEKLLAIDHKEYSLDDGMCVIADEERALALAGIMGGAESEVGPSTTDVLIESAEFSPQSVRATARKLKLHSAASYRFERGIDGARVDWASRRCCQLIQQIAGGELDQGAVFAGQLPAARTPITLRLKQIPRILGIEVPTSRIVEILLGLGCTEEQRDSQTLSVTPPTWRRDLTREIDLIEEVARVHGYDKIPEDTRVPMTASFRSDADRIQNRIRSVLTSAGLDEALTLSMVSQAAAELFSPWTASETLVAETAILEGADRLRRSLIPSLLAARQYNEAKQNPAADFFELAKVYLRHNSGLPTEQLTLGIVTSGGYSRIKGLVEAVIRGTRSTLTPEIVPYNGLLLDINQSGMMVSDGQTLAVMGVLSTHGREQAGLRSQTSIAEINLLLLMPSVVMIPAHVPLSNFPVVVRDLNLVVDESVRWGELAATVRIAGGPLLENLEYKETYRDSVKDGIGKKRLLFTVTLRSSDRTLTNEEADRVRSAIVAAAAEQFGARLLDA